MDPHGMSGQINIVTGSAFDRDGMFASTRVSLGEQSHSGGLIDDQGPDQRFDLTLSNTFGANNQFGVSLAGSYHNLSSTTKGYSNGKSANSLIVVEDVLAARQNGMFAHETTWEKYSAMAKFEYQPNEDTYAYVTLGHFVVDDHETRWENLIWGGDLDMSTVTANSGTWNEAAVEHGYVYQPKVDTTDLLSAHLHHWLDNEQAIRVDLSHSRSHTDLLRDMTRFEFESVWNDQVKIDYTINDDGFEYRFHDEDYVNDLNNYSNAYIRNRSEDISNNLTYAAFNYDNNVDGISGPWGFNLGVNLTHQDLSFDRKYTEGRLFDDCGADDFTECGFSSMNGFVHDFTLPFHGGVPMYFIDDTAARVRWAEQGYNIFRDRTRESIQDDYELTEELYAAFGQAFYRGEALTVRAGLRYDYSRVSVDLFQYDANVEEFNPITRDYNHGYLLPSVVASYDLNLDTVVRLGYSRTLGRPNFGHYATNETVQIWNPGDEYLNITQSNTDLKPRVSDNFDASLEYYFDEGASMLSAAYFYKDVSNMIYTRETLVENYEHEGHLVTARITSPQNATDAYIQGLELSVRVDMANYLPSPFDGLIFNANTTFIDSELTMSNVDGEEYTADAWANQPDFLANVSLSYDKGRFGANLALNHVGSYTQHLDQDKPDNNLYRDASSSLDGQLRYSVTDSIKVLLEGQNLTNEKITNYRDLADFGRVIGDVRDQGRTVWLGVTWIPQF
ncbi:hypothetical protein GCM10023333_25790 [Ferrimonas pelagia]|uniref:TonB-dependent receptor-like beta-barrel domain-containing protein n=2 Tax=Ferrimonas pelagia TaxID=1177826 RepID=A0ABP9F0C7_9GAMM